MANRFSLDIPDIFYQPANPVGKFMGAMDAAAAKREEQRRFELELQMKRDAAAQYARQNDQNDRRMGLQDQREQQKHEMDVSDRNRKLSSDLGGLVAGGQFGEADALAAGSQYIDPRTGKATAPTFDRGAPGTPAATTPDYQGMMKALPMWGGVQESINAQPGLEDVGAPVTTPGKAAVNPSMTTASGQRVEFSPDERAQQAQRMADKKRDGIMALLAGNPNLSPQARQTLELQAGLTGAQASGQTNAAVTGTEAQRRGQEFTGEQNDLNRANARTLKAMGGKKGTSKTDERGDKRIAMAEEGGARQLAKDVLASYGFKEVQAQNRKFNDMASELGASPNAALDAVIAGTFVKQAQGGTGVISDSDMEAFWNRIGGVSDKSSQWVSNVLSGKIDPDKRAKVAEAVQWLAKQNGANLGVIQGAMTHAFANSKNYSAYGDQMVGTYFPGARKAKPDAAGSGAAPAAGGKPQNGHVITLKSGRKAVYNAAENRYVPQ